MACKADRDFNNIETPEGRWRRITRGYANKALTENGLPKRLPYRQKLLSCNTLRMMKKKEEKLTALNRNGNLDSFPDESGFFISFEGQEGAGKTTQMEMLAHYLSTQGWSVLRTREPGGTPLGEKIRKMVKHSGEGEAPCPKSELLLMAASRAQLFEKEIAPALRAGKIVLCDRFIDSTTVYQGFGRGLDMEFIARLHRFIVGTRLPDLTLLFDLEVSAGAHRSRQRAAGENYRDRFEQEHNDFHELIREGFLKLAAEKPERMKIIEARNSSVNVHQAVLKAVEPGLCKLRQKEVEGRQENA